MIKIDKNFLNDYLGPVLVLIIKTKCSRHQMHYRYLKVVCVFYPLHSPRPVTENLLKKKQKTKTESKYELNDIRLF